MQTEIELLLHWTLHKMFAKRYFPGTMFASRYYPPVGTTIVLNRKVCISGVWKDVEEVYVCIGESWKLVTEFHVCVGETWKLSLD